MFKINEILELKKGLKYIVIDTINYDNNDYYYLYQVSDDEKDVIKELKIITTVNENNRVFVHTVTGDLFNYLKQIHNSK